jgi:hypothetical protein
MVSGVDFEVGIGGEFILQVTQGMARDRGVQFHRAAYPRVRHPVHGQPRRAGWHSGISPGFLQVIA